MLDNGTGAGQWGQVAAFDQEILHAAVLDGNLISNLGDEAMGSARLCFNQM